MHRSNPITVIFAFLAIILLGGMGLRAAFAQGATSPDQGLEEPLPVEEDMPTEAPPATPPTAAREGLPGPEDFLPLPLSLPPPLVEEPVKTGEAREGETRWNVDITGAVVMNYVFNESPDSFTVKYRWEVKGQVNAATAVIKGDADINANVEGPLSKWPTGECRLQITIPKVPFELDFRKTSAEKSNMRLTFKKAVNEEWASKCTFTDTPGAKFDTRGAPEAWLAKALEKARPPLRDIIANIGTEETTTRFVISKETINDAPLGSGEIEGTGVITIKPGGS